MSKNITKSISYAAGFYRRTFEEFIEFAGTSGFSGVQFIPDQAPNLYSEFDEGRTHSIKERLSALGLSVSVHNVFYDINLCSLVPDVADFSRTITRKVLEFSQAVGAGTLTVHPGYMYPGWRNDPLQNKEFWRSAESNLSELAELGSEFNVQILLENGSYCLSAREYGRKSEFHLGIDIAELAKLLELGGSEMGVCMDIGKLRASGVNPKEFVDTFSEVIREVQVSSSDDFDFVRRLEEVSHDSAVNVVFEGRDEAERDSFLAWG